jgi:ATP-dependent DNA ligase
VNQRTNTASNRPNRPKHHTPGTFTTCYEQSQPLEQPARTSPPGDEFPRNRAPDFANSFTFAFDLLAEGDRDWRPEPHRVRRARLEALFTGVLPPLQLMPCATDRDEALPWLDRSSALVGVEGLVLKRRDQPYRAGRTGDWRKIRQTVVVDAVVIGVAGPVVRPEAVVLARRDQTGQWRPIGLSLPLSPGFRDTIADRVRLTGEPARRLPGAILGHPGTEYQPVHPELVVEVEAEPTVETFNARLRPRVHRIRPDLSPADIPRPP